MQKQIIQFSKWKGSAWECSWNSRNMNSAEWTRIAKKSLQCILTENLRLHTYKFQLTQKLTTLHSEKNPLNELLNINKWMWMKSFSAMNHIFTLMPLFIVKIADFWGSVNRHILSTNKCVAVWCGFLVGGIIGPYWSSSVCYWCSISSYDYGSFFLHDMWFQQDGATWHTASYTIQCMKLFLLVYSLVSVIRNAL